jgi:hypothetical protein
MSERLIRHFVANRDTSKEMYGELYNYLSQNKYLTMAGDSYPRGDSSADYIFRKATDLGNKLQLPHLDTIRQLVDQNALVYAKVILAFYRRLDDAAKFFAQGRMAFESASK